MSVSPKLPGLWWWYVPPKACSRLPGFITVSPGNGSLPRGYTAHKSFPLIYRRGRTVCVGRQGCSILVIRALLSPHP